MKKRDNKKKQIVLGLFIVVIMVSSILGYALRGEEPQEQETVYQGFDYSLEEVQNIEIGDFELITNKVYLAYVPEQNNANLQRAMNKVGAVLSAQGFRVVLACTEEEDCPNIPLVDCSNEFQVVSFVESEYNKIYKEGNCIILECTSEEISKCADRFDYALLGEI